MKSIQFAILGIVLAAVSLAGLAAYADSKPAASGSPPATMLAHDGGGGW